MDSQTCWAPTSVVFSKTGFKYITICANYGDIGSNPPGPRGNEHNEGVPRIYFPEYQIFASYINCRTKEEHIKNFTRLTTLKKSDPFIIDLGQGDKGIRVLGTTDPVTDERIKFEKPVWVIDENHPPYSLVEVRHGPTIEKIINPSCKAHKEFWNNTKLAK